jgi:hypothetical protein
MIEFYRLEFEDARGSQQYRDFETSGGALIWLLNFSGYGYPILNKVKMSALNDGIHYDLTPIELTTTADIMDVIKDMPLGKIDPHKTPFQIVQELHKILNG